MNGKESPDNNATHYHGPSPTTLEINVDANERPRDSFDQWHDALHMAAIVVFIVAAILCTIFLGQIAVDIHHLVRGGFVEAPWVNIIDHTGQVPNG